MARPSGLNDRVREKIVDGIRAGAYGESAVRAAGISVRSFYDWQRVGRDVVEQLEEGTRSEAELTDHERACCALTQAVAEATLEVQLRHIGVIETAATGGDWRASAWFLERRLPDLFQRRERQDASASEVAPEPIVVQVITTGDVDEGTAG